jgi:hypothetical protein
MGYTDLDYDVRSGHRHQQHRTPADRGVPNPHASRRAAEADLAVQLRITR